jgi:hypothetical protein
MAATIKIKNSSTASAVPTSSDLVQGELAVNVTDKRIFTENASGTVVELGTNPSILTLPDGSASAPTLTNDGDTNTGLFFPAADTVAVTTGGTERARIDSSGNLGVGRIPTSSYKIDTQGDTGIRILDSAAARELTLTPPTASGDAAFVTSSSANGLALRASSGSGSVIFASGGTSEKMRLDTSGNLGIGTSSPNQKLDVNGASVVRGTLTARQTSALAFDYVTASNLARIISYGPNTSTAGVISFVTESSDGSVGGERARIDSSGNLLVGTTSQVNSGKVCFVGDFNSSNGIVLKTTYASTGSIFALFANSAGSTAGYITQNGTTTVQYVTSSDYRLKENITPMTGALAKVAALKPCTYTWKEDGSVGQGFIAHELQEVVPDAVAGNKDDVYEDGSIKPQGIDTSFLVATLTAAIQELKAEFDAYKASHP